MTGIVDMHCHVLPGLDDGPATMEESIALLREASWQGVHTMIVTPHFHPGRYKISAGKVLDTLEQVREQLLYEDFSMRLLPGQECYYYSGLRRELKAGRVLTLAGGPYVLVEFDPNAMYSLIHQAVEELDYAGYHPIIAHFERYGCLRGRPDRLSELREDGARLQLNFDTLMERETFFRKNPWRQYVRDGFVDFLGSDAHGAKKRPLRVTQAVNWMQEELRPIAVNRILKRNIRLIVGDLPENETGRRVNRMFT